MQQRNTSASNDTQDRPFDVSSTSEIYKALAAVTPPAKTGPSSC